MRELIGISFLSTTKSRVSFLSQNIPKIQGNAIMQEMG
jgi:hypothetical protein